MTTFLVFDNGTCLVPCRPNQIRYVLDYFNRIWIVELGREQPIEESISRILRGANNQRTLWGRNCAENAAR